MTPSPLEYIDDIGYECQLYLKRDDLLTFTSNDPLCGNKWRKLKYNLKKARREGYHKLATFGGAYSNHIAAVASAGIRFGFQTIGIIRGEETLPLNPTITFARQCGMKIAYMDRTTYRRKSEKEVIDQLHEQYGPFYLIPEGGTNQLAIKGAAEIVPEIYYELGRIPDYICVSCGTGGTLAGIIQGMEGKSRAVGFAALKGNFLTREVSQWINPDFSNWSIQPTYHFGGYAKSKPELISFIRSFKRRYGIQLDPIYTGKMMYGILDIAKKGYFAPSSTVVAIHTGGLQGIAGFEQRWEIEVIEK